MVRFAEIEGLLNFRDLGGYESIDGGSTQRGRVFRSDSLHRATPAGRQLLVDRYALTTAIDLRSAEERKRTGMLPEDLGIRCVHIDVIDRGMNASHNRASIDAATSVGQIYLSMARSSGAAFAEAVTVIAESDGPVAYYCSAGKDRTGILSALILSLVGVGDDHVMADFAVTDLRAKAITDRSMIESPGIEKVWSRLPEGITGAPIGAMAELIELLRQEYGGWPDYAATHGVTDDTVARLRRLLLVPT